MLSFIDNQPLLRRGQLKSKAIYLGLSLFFALSLALSSSISAGKKATHIVKKGDTLWSICEKYYGDPYLWPELWEMNQFVTNPHWISPGDVITLFEYKEKKLKPVKKVVKLKKQPVKIRKLMGIDVSSLTNTKALGLLLHEMIVPWGKIFDFEAEKILLSKDDTVYVKMYKEDIKPGDKFTIYSISNLINHPLTGEKFGYIYFFKGILEMGKAQKGYHIAKISESFKTIYKNDLLIPYHPVSSCVLPIPYQDNITAHIVAAKDKLELLGQYSVVYIDAGSSKNVQKGNIFEAIQERESISEPLKKETVALPPAILGKILILKTTENTSTGVVFWASKNFTNGIKVRPKSWHKQLKELANLPTCPFK
ncbi:MAG: LysM peptidoglycan-binding domain-containing protein [Desulfobacteraceae bacterium]|nr:MAG: LysM peptidoglycan-binding domain-containing protein [Desulfobacteraceae bacterium]